MKRPELAKALGVSLKTIDNWENDRTHPRDSLGAIEDVLGMKLDEGPPEPDVLQEVIDAYGKEVADAIVESVPDPDDRARVFAAMLRRRRGEPEPPPTGPGAETPPGGTRRAG